MKSVFTVDEKWRLHVSIKHSPPWVDKNEQNEPQPKASLHPLKVMISIWCDSRGIMQCWLLPSFIALTVDLYCQQLDRMAAKMAGKRPNHDTIQFLHDNAHPLTIKVTRQKLLDIGWKVLTL
ncbi:hypothetical protein Y032_1012g3392 [Ancylostoma ceylanicum]|uniref:Transposase n=1 Tax=Ancylostoma ceylanicum TaxID=53326 RepID=A0A016W7N2_9BILA|nr:hypothetical protein Y032_1012g3392 [Ancylostoma ceylanicum]